MEVYRFVLYTGFIQQERIWNKLYDIMKKKTDHLWSKKKKPGCKPIQQVIHIYIYIYIPDWCRLKFSSLLCFKLPQCGRTQLLSTWFFRYQIYNFKLHTTQVPRSYYLNKIPSTLTSSMWIAIGESEVDRQKNSSRF